MQTNGKYWITINEGADFSVSSERVTKNEHMGPTKSSALDI